jgi:hypothetical protein
MAEATLSWHCPAYEHAGGSAIVMERRRAWRAPPGHTAKLNTPCNDRADKLRRMQPPLVTPARSRLADR